MSFFHLKTEAIRSRIAEEELYALVLREIESGVRRDGLWAKALANADGNEEKAKGLYIEYRAQSLLDEIDIAKHLSERQAETARELVVAERNRAIDECSKTLAHFGYRLMQKSGGWEIREPLGGRVRTKSLEQLVEYTRSKQFQGNAR
jgi:hypothetical protein